VQFPLVPTHVSRKKISKLEFVSLGTRFGAAESNTTKRPPVPSEDSWLSPPTASVPSFDRLARPIVVAGAGSTLNVSPFDTWGGRPGLKTRLQGKNLYTYVAGTTTPVKSTS
jgi:hypothetical protein